MRKLSESLHRTIFVLFILFAVYIITYVLNVFFYLGIPLYGQHKVIVYGFVLFFIFLVIPSSKKTTHYIPWYDVLLALISLVATVYLVWNWQGIFYGVRLDPLQLQIFAATIIVATLEATRRCLGWAFTFIGLFFIIYPLFGKYFPSIFFTRQFSFSRISEVFYYSENGVYGSAMGLFATIVVIFFIFGAFINQSKASNLLIDCGYALAGGFRGGPAKVSILTSAMFSSISGVGAANVVATGTFTIPLMRKYGFEGKQAAAIEAVASSGGILMPPIMGSAAFLMADFLRVPYWNVIVAAIIPALLYYIGLFVMVDCLANKSQMKGIPRHDLPKLFDTLKKYGHFITPVFVLIFVLGYLKYSAQLAALYAIFSLVLVSYLRRSTWISIGDIGIALYKGVFGFLKLAPAAAIVGIIIASVNMTGLSVTLVSGLRDLAGGNLLLLLIYIAIASIILGMGSSPLLVYIVLVVLLVPAMVDLGVVPIAAHFFILYYSTAALLTPPVALSVIVAAGIAKASFWPTAWESLRLSVTVFIIPFIFALSPALLMQGTIAENAYAFLTTVLGIILISGSLTGFLLQVQFSWWQRTVMLFGSIFLFLPNNTTDIYGVIIFLVPVFLLIRKHYQKEQHVKL